MKILRITLNNIASLAGTHTVDFTQEPLRSAGLYSISGPTGAGKSSLLDALCLALYDDTPRIRLAAGRMAELRNGESQNDPRSLLRRGAAEGFAEVVFVGVDQKTWTARWRVRRSHLKPDGNLQPSEMTLYEGKIAPGGEGLVSVGGKKTLVKPAIEEKIGLTFAQFTRAVLLAQNDFAAFLKADDAERAAILQALTGTERFEQISKNVHLRCSEEKKKTEALEGKLAGNQPLSPEALAEAEQKSVELDLQVSAAAKQLEVLNAYLQWFHQLAKLSEELQAAEQRWKTACNLRDAAKPRREELEFTEYVSREARSLRQAEIQAEKLKQRRAAEHLQCEESLKAQRAKFEHARQQLEEAEQILVQTTAQEQACLPLLQKARDLDSKLQPLQANFEKATQAFANAEQAQKVALDALEATKTNKATLERELAQIELEQRTLSAFIPLIPHAPRLLDRLDQLITAQQQTAEKQAEAEKYELELNEKQRLLIAEEEKTSRLRASLDEAIKRLQAASTAEQSYDTQQLAASRRATQDSLQILSRFAQQGNELQALCLKQETLTNDLNCLTDATARDRAQLTEIDTTFLPAAKNAVEIAEKQLNLTQAALDDHAKRLRLALHPDHHCPVCGSTEHPYRQHAPDLETTAIQTLKNSLASYQAELVALQNSQAELRAATRFQTEQLASKQQELQQTNETINAFRFESDAHPEVAALLLLPVAERQATIAQRCTLLEQEIREIEASEAKHRAAVQTTTTCVAQKDQALDEHNKHVQTLAELKSQVVLAKQHAEQAKRVWQEVANHSAEHATRLDDLWSCLPQAKADFEASPPVFRASFMEQTEKCRRLLTEFERLNQECRRGHDSLAQQTELANQKVEFTAERKAELDRAAQDRDSLLIERKSLFNGEAAETVEAELRKKIQESVAVRDAKAKELSAIENFLASCQTAANKAMDELKLAEESLQRDRSGMDAWLEQVAKERSRPLAREELDRILSRNDAWLVSERKVLNDLVHAVENAQGACDVYSKQLQEHRERRPTTDEAPAVSAAIAAQQESFRQAKEAADHARAVLLNDAKLRQSCQQLAEQLTEQKRVADPWLKLNDLLGSSDGAKFRNIAQRKTLDLLLRYANQQLNQLAVRYRLERLPESLNLVVVDRDMGDECRSVHSLSGGESFLVSLALALGLASLTSNRLRIESLFIDEGFGSLDPQTLSTAMGALMHLEAQGRKVGVISHVAEMTDAIPVQVKVIKGRGGLSRIEVPGAPVPIVAASPTSGSGTVASPPPKATFPPKSAEEIASLILAILQQKQLSGKAKVSIEVLRKQIGCESSAIKAAQILLENRVILTGRSLQLANAEATIPPEITKPPDSLFALD